MTLRPPQGTSTLTTTRATTRTTGASPDSPTMLPEMPAARPSRTVVEAVRPVVDGGNFAAKAALGRPMTVLADVFTDGHDVVFAEAAFHPPARTNATGTNAAGTDAAGSAARIVAMTPTGNDRFTASTVPGVLGRWTYDVSGWVSHAETWRRGTAAKIDAGIDVSVEAEIGRALITEMIETPHVSGDVADGPDADENADVRADVDRLRRFRDELASGDTSSVADDSWSDVFHRREARHADRLDRPLPVDVDPLRATIGSWYSFFPRSIVETGAGDGAGEHPGLIDGEAATLRDAVGRLDHIADMGFDVVYIPPVHPIGTTNRKGRDNATLAEAGDVGSPYAIGSAAGGHRSVAPELGTVDDVAALGSACRERDMDLAIDIAFNCSPDHPWVSEHPDWFTTRPDGTIQYAENPPKKYEDIYPLNFETPDWQALWHELADVFRFWIGHGVTIFRVDNPHTKSFAFWEWAIASIRTDHPEAIFLSEAFTRPRVMQRLAKIGFNQSYTYFAWRHTAAELREYFEELSTDTIDFMRPNAWPNTHDILTEQLQTGGRAGFVSRAVLAATLSPSWGVYGPVYELMETTPRDGVEDYGNSEKYEVRRWALGTDDSLAPLLGRLNSIRAAQPALTELASIRFHGADDDALLCFTKTDPGGDGAPVLVVVNCDPHGERHGFVDIDLAAVGLAYGCDYELHDHLGGATYHWSGNRNYVELSPHGAMAHIFTIHGGKPAETSTNTGGTH